MKKIKVKYLIIGAGISGLTFANYIHNNYLIIEKENEVGGYCRTIKIGEFIWDYAGHFFHFKTDEFKQKFINSFMPNDLVKKIKCTKILYKKHLIDYPFQSNIHQLNKAEFIDCLYDLYNKKERNEYDNFLDMLYGKFGKSIVDKFLKPYNEKLYACNLKVLDTEAMGRFFPYANIHEIVNNMKGNKALSYNNSFLYPKNGAGSFMNKLYDNLDKSKVKLNTKIVAIDFDKKTAKTDNNFEIEFEYLINTSPLNNFLTLFKKDINYLNLQKSLSYNKVLVLNLGFNKKSKIKKEHWIYIPDPDLNYYRIGFYDNILNYNKLSMYIEIGYSKDEPIDINSQLDLTLKNLLKNGIIDKDTLLEEHSSVIMDPAYVHINKDIDTRIKKLMVEINKEKIYSIGRYGSWTYCSMEDCMVEAKKLANQLI